MYFSSLMLYLHEIDECSLNLLWSSFHDVCKSNRYVVHLKLIQCWMSIIPQ